KRIPGFLFQSVECGFLTLAANLAYLHSPSSLLRKELARPPTARQIRTLYWRWHREVAPTPGFSPLGSYLTGEHRPTPSKSFASLQSSRWSCRCLNRTVGIVRGP